MPEENKHGMYILAIVAIIAIVSLVVMINGAKKSTTFYSEDLPQQDVVGQGGGTMTPQCEACTQRCYDGWVGGPRDSYMWERCYSGPCWEICGGAIAKRSKPAT